jgi:hypothetical protein
MMRWVGGVDQDSERIVVRKWRRQVRNMDVWMGVDSSPPGAVEPMTTTTTTMMIMMNVLTLCMSVVICEIYTTFFHLVSLGVAHRI